MTQVKSGDDEVMRAVLVAFEQADLKSEIGMIKPQHCSYCHRETRQTLLQKNETWVPNEIPFKPSKSGITESVWSVVMFMEHVFQCNGCGHLHLFLQRWSYPDAPGANQKWQLPTVQKRPQPNWFKDVDPDLFELLGEIYSNFNSDNFISFSICCRTLLDKLLTASLGDVGGFDKKLDLYLTGGHVTKVQKDALAVLVEAGNASAHRGFKADPALSEVIIDIVEHILKEAVISGRAEIQAPNIPARP